MSSCRGLRTREKQFDSRCTPARRQHAACHCAVMICAGLDPAAVQRAGCEGQARTSPAGMSCSALKLSTVDLLRSAPSKSSNLHRRSEKLDRAPLLRAATVVSSPSLVRQHLQRGISLAPGKVRHAVVVEHRSARVDARAAQPTLAWRRIRRHDLRRQPPLGGTHAESSTHDLTVIPASTQMLLEPKQHCLRTHV